MTKSILILSLFFYLGCSTPSPLLVSKSGFKGKNYIGAVIEEITMPVSNNKVIRLGFLIPGASAERMGLLPGDLITKVNGAEVASLGTPAKESFAKFIRNYKREDIITFTLIRPSKSKIKEFDISGHVERRTYGNGPKVMKPNDADLLPSFMKRRSEPFSKLNKKIISKNKVESDYKELQETFSLMTNRADVFRRELVTYVQRNPFEISNISKDLIQNISGHQGMDKLEELLSLPKVKTFRSRRLKSDPIEYIKMILNQSYYHLQKAYKSVTMEDRQFVVSHYRSFLKYIDENIMLRDMKEIKEFKKYSDILEKIKMEQVFAARKTVMVLKSSSLKKSLKKYLKGRDKVVLKSPYGQIIIGGEGSNTYQGNPDKVALLIDLGGDDLYLGRFGAASGSVLLSMLIDFGGNDKYQASWDCSFGCGLLGLGILIDLKGSDSYRGVRLSQGASFGGVGVLIDEAGNDSYKGLSHSQSYSFYGASLLDDIKGNDSYEAKLFSQGVAVAGGVSLLKDQKGNDHYQALGLYPSSYGTKGIYRSFSQGVGFGFRSFMSGGIGILSDQSGDDFFEAGNFSQGAGYYFGFGIFHNGDRGSDKYIGSRYTQGATAHYALASFLEEGGNDHYISRHTVSAGMAWDLGITYFEDSSGDDLYDTKGMTMGSAAQNSISIFVDREGNDDYRAQNHPASIPTNKARDGISLGYFFDLSGKDKYLRAKNDSRGVVDHFGFWFDGSAWPNEY